VANLLYFARGKTLSNKWTFSATEIETFELCRRKWAYQYLDGSKPPQSKAAKLGLLVHKVLEKHLTGYPIDYQSDEGRIAKSGLHYIPQSLPRENVEHAFLFLKKGHIFHGYIDFFEQVGSQTWLVGDHKTISSLHNALGPNELKQNIQANIYAQWVFREKNAKAVNLRWIYYRTKSTPKALCVEAELTPEQANDNFADIVETADEILAIVKEKQPSSAQPKNTSACFKYGRCAFYAKCKSTAQTIHLHDPFSINIEESLMASSFHLYVDCVPTKSEITYQRTIELSELLKPVLSKIQTEKELSHYRLAGYGQHVGLIANYLREHLEKNAYDHRTAILSSIKSPEGCDTLQTLSAAAGLVVRGL
jgi:hypothetical protein